MSRALADLYILPGLSFLGSVFCGASDVVRQLVFVDG